MSLLRRRSGITAIILCASVALLAVGLATPATAYPGAPWFEPGKVYTQNFPDPNVLRVGSDYYAYGTGTGGSYLPIMSSRDQATWVTREAYRSGPASNDGLLATPRWAYNNYAFNSHMTSWVTAPGVEQFGSTFNAYYGVWVGTNPDRHCISVATSSSPKGPFVDNSSVPLVCDGRSPGSFDPSPFIDPATGIKYLLWTSEGPGTGANPPLKLWSRQLNGDGLAFAPGSAPREVLRETGGWEFPVVENPSMVRHQGQLFLIYSGNQWWTDRYAVGYAVCDTPLGPCQKRGQILTSNGDRQGPGGASAFLEADGRLKLAYHYWQAPYVGYPADTNCDGGGQCTSQGQRRMAIVELSNQGGGRLQTLSPVDAKYNALGGASGALGSPVIAESDSVGGRFRHYQAGSIYWSPPTGAQDVRGAIRDRWMALGWERGGLGYPVTSDARTGDGRGWYNHFQGGTVIYSGATGAQDVQGAIRSHWAALGSENGGLGYPTTGDARTGDGRGWYNHFQGGTVIYSAATGAQNVRGAIRNHWASLGSERGPLGYPATSEARTGDGVGWYNHFQGGTVIYSAASGARDVRGSIRGRWAALGSERGPLGYPVTSDARTGDGVGWYNHFQGGTIIYSAASGTHDVRGAIRNRWASLGSERGALGYPISDEYDVPGGKRNDFQRGSITWDARTGTTTVR